MYIYDQCYTFTHGEGDLDLSAMAMSSSEPDSSTSFLSVTSPLSPAADRISFEFHVMYDSMMH